MTQQNLFDAKPKPPVLSPVAKEKKRLSNQCRKILERLQRGPATNAELSSISLKYTGRNSELRSLGHDVRVVEHDRSTGRVVYALFINGQELQCDCAKSES